MKKHAFYMIVSVIVILLTLDCVHNHFFTQTSDLWIQVGIPVSFDEAGNVSATYYGEVLKDRQETDIILLAMVNAQPIVESAYPVTPPDAMMTIHYEAAGYMYQVWFREDSIVFGNEHTVYKEIQNDHTNIVPILKNLVDFLKNNQNFS